MAGFTPEPSSQRHDRLPVVDLFAGAGGWEEALRALGHDALGIEVDPWACATARAAGHARLQADVSAHVNQPNPLLHSFIDHEWIPAWGWPMSGGAEPRAYVSARQLQQVRDGLAARDQAILRQVAELRLMSARHIQAIHFPDAEHDNERAATRARQRVLERLVGDRLLFRLERRIGGVRAGSNGFVFALGPIGQRALALDGPRRRWYEPTTRFLDHTLAISQLVVDLIVASRQGSLELLGRQTEPRCWREFSGVGGRTVVRPDLFVALGVGAYELRWFVEVDRASESLPTVLRKCRLYADYYQAGVEQASSGGVFPRICWVVPNEARAKRVLQAIHVDKQLPAGLFVVATEADAMMALRGSQAHG